MAEGQSCTRRHDLAKRLAWGQQTTASSEAPKNVVTPEHGIQRQQAMAE